MNMNLTNKNALVCGSTQGIGKSIAIELANMGANVTLLARSEEKLKLVLSDLDASLGQSHSYACADFSNQNEVEIAVESILFEKNDFFCSFNFVHISNYKRQLLKNGLTVV